MIEGKVWKYGDNINTDIISPPIYMELKIAGAAKHAMEPIDLDFASKYRPGEIFVAENNLGSGSSRETAPLTLYALGVRVVIAKSYARIFYRNCINIGILALVCKDADQIDKGDLIQVDYINGEIINCTKNEEYVTDKIPKQVMDIIDCGGLLAYLDKKNK